MVFAGFMSQNNLIPGGSPPATTPYELTNASYTQDTSHRLILTGYVTEDVPTGLCMLDGGIRLFYTHDLGTGRSLVLINLVGAHDLATAAPTASVGTGITGGNPTGLFVDALGTDFWYSHNPGSGNDLYYYNTMNSPFTPSAGTTQQDSINVGSLGMATTERNVEAMTMAYDAGTSTWRFYAIHLGSAGTIWFQHDFGAGYPNFTTMTNTNKITMSLPGGADIRGIDMKSDGTKFYLLDSGNESIYEYDASTPYDITTATLTRTLVINILFFGAHYPGGSPIWSDISVDRQNGHYIYVTNADTTGGVNRAIYKIDLV